MERKFGSVTPSCGIKVPDTRRQLADLEGMLQDEKTEFTVRLLLVLYKCSIFLPCIVVTG